MIFTRGFRTREEAEQHRRRQLDPYAWIVLNLVDADGVGELMACALIPKDVAKVWMGSK